MEIKIVNDRKNLLLERREVDFQVIHMGKPTPPKHEVAQKLAAKLDAKMDLMLIENYTTSFGMNTSEGTCLVYENEKAMMRAEPTKLMNPKKRVGLKEKKAEDKKPEEPKEEKPKEVPKEEVKEEAPATKENNKPEEEPPKEEPNEAKPSKEEKKDEAQTEQKK